MATINETWTHADTASGISADQPWTTISGTPKITGNRATGAPSSSYSAKMDTLADTPDYSFELDLTTGTVIGAGEGRMMFRMQDNSNYYSFVTQKTVFYLSRTIAGSNATIAGPTSVMQYAVGQRNRVEIKGSQIKCYVRAVGATDFTLLLSATDTTYPTGRQSGILVSGSTSTFFFDNLAVADFPPHFTIQTITPIAYEKSLNAPKAGLIRITAIPAPVGGITIPLSFAGSTAAAGIDYATIPTSVNIPNGQDHVDINVTPLFQAGVYKTDRVVRINPGASGAYTVDPFPFAEVTIKTIEYDKFNGIVGATPTSIDRFVTGDAKGHLVTDPATGPVGYYRTGKVGNRCVLVSPLGNAMYVRAQWDTGPFDGSTPFQTAAAARFGVGDNASAVGYPTCDFLVKAATRVGFNLLGGNTHNSAMPIPRLNNAITANPHGLVPAQRPGSTDKKAVKQYNSGQLRTMKVARNGGYVKNIGDTLLFYKNIVGAAKKCLPDVFDDPDVMPGAPGQYKLFCDGTAGGTGFMRDLGTYPTWDTSPLGPEYAPSTTPWNWAVDWVERDFCTAMANYHASAGYVIAASNPSFLTAAVRDQGSVTYLEPTNWTKLKWSQYLQTKYTTIAALNTAWATASYGFPNFYTTFGSAGSFGTGTGILDEAGDRPWFGGPNGDAIRLDGVQVNLRDDLDAMEELYWDQLIGKLYTGLRNAFPNVMMYASGAASMDASYLFTKSCAKFVDMLAGEKDYPAFFYYSPPTSGFVALTLSATTGANVTVTAGVNTFTRVQRGTLIKCGTGVGFVHKFNSFTQVVIEVLSPFSSVNIATNTWEFRPPTEGWFMKTGLPNFSWSTVICNDSYFPNFINGSGSPTTGQAVYNGSPFSAVTTFYNTPGGRADTQLKRANLHAAVQNARLGTLAPNGICPNMGYEWWAALDKWAEGTAFGIVSIDCKMYDGVDRPQNGDFYTPMLQLNMAADYALLQLSQGLAPSAPVITSVLHSGDTSVSGTGTNGATITVFKNSVSQGTTVVASGVWTLGGLTMATGNAFTATQTIGSATSVVSNSVIVLSATLAAPVITGTYVEGNTTVVGTGPVGATITMTITPLGGNSFVVATVGVVDGAGNWTITLPSLFLFQDDDITTVASLGGQVSAVSNTKTVGSVSPARVRIQIVRYKAGDVLMAVLRAAVPRAEMSRYSGKTPIYARTLPQSELVFLTTGRVVERIVKRSGPQTFAEAQTTLETLWNTFQTDVSGSNSTGADGTEAQDSTWDGAAWT